MDALFSNDLTNSPYAPDLNSVAFTGVLVKDPELLVQEHGGLIAIVVLAIEGKLQPTAWGSLGQQTYVVDAWGMGSVAEQLATMQIGSCLKLSGSLDYLYRDHAEHPTDRIVLAVRIEEVTNIAPLPN